MQNHLWVEANIQVTVNSHNVKEYRVSQKNSALALLQQQAHALFLLGHPVDKEEKWIWLGEISHTPNILSFEWNHLQILTI